MYAAQGFEHISSGLGTGAFGVLLLRLTEKRFSATQYALLSSLFTLPRVLAGPVAGVAADAFGWRDFFVLTVFTGIPGLLMLARFVPWNARVLEFKVAEPLPGGPLGKGALAAWGLAGALVTGVASALSLACLNALALYRTSHVFGFTEEGRKLLSPSTFGGGLTLLGLVIVAAVGGLVTAAAASARRSPLAPE
jgi:PAT family beta-lactamase induction signal transducer AmpG